MTVNGTSVDRNSYRPVYYKLVKPTRHDGWLVEVYDIQLKAMGILSHEGNPLSFETPIEAEAEAHRRNLRSLRGVN